MFLLFAERSSVVEGEETDGSCDNGTSPRWKETVYGVTRGLGLVLQSMGSLEGKVCP